MSTLPAESRPLFPQTAVVASLPPVLLLAACSGSMVGQRPNLVHEFACSEDRSFQVQIADERASVTTSAAAAYALLRRDSSIGRKYTSSAGVTLIIDDDRAVLVGAAGGPFHGCRRR